ncbi:Alkaline phosphatase like protein [uncultured Leptolyngbya sp.]|uniref:Alkaline phosphatase like protein n=1 Tax=uncultured Leptolyngbya sp. TaxID=332963 RepID=A0A6J4MFS0_9CYAN|nr:Alkaline phosphatase like protein [uncultured Leptolyngbya sp.]
MSKLLATWVVSIMTKMGYLGVGLLMFLENLFPPIPSELIMPLAGFTVAKGEMDFTLVVFAGVVGTMLGALPWYYCGKLLGEERLRRLADRYGKWIAMSGKDIDKANLWFSKHGGKAVFLCRLVPGVRTIISLPAGISEMPMIAFLFYSTLGTTVWISLLTGLGYLLGNNYTLVDEYLGPVSKFVFFGLIGLFIFWVIRRRRKLRATGR